MAKGTFTINGVTLAPAMPGAGGIGATELYEALQYSGLVTEDMTVEEMLEVLNEYFVGSFQLISNGTFADGYTSTFEKTSNSWNTNNNYYTIIAQNPSPACVETYVIAWDSTRFDTNAEIKVVVNKKTFKNLKLTLVDFWAF